MVIVFISYLFIFYIIFGFGVVFRKWIPLENFHILYTLLLGLFFLLNLSTYYALFFPIDYIFVLFIFCGATASIIYHRSIIYEIIKNSITEYKTLSVSKRAIFWCITLITLIHTSSAPTLADNESYYIQTIKWFNQYGLVKGLANLHLFLGQASGWHLLQSSLNFNFINYPLNDLNGFILIAVNYFSLIKLNAFQRNNNKLDLFIGLLLITIPGQLLFIDSPSTDLPILLIVPIIVYLFLKSLQQKENKNFVLILFLSILAILIKVTIAPILLLPIILVFKFKSIPHLGLVSALSLISLVGFILKNIIITGYPLYPLNCGQEIIDVDWKLNHVIQNAYYEWTTLYAWKIEDFEVFQKLNFIEKFKLWLTQNGISGIMNKTIFLSLLVFPVYFYNRKNMILLYTFIGFQFCVFYFTSPQYRFFLPILLVIALIFMVKLLFNHKFIYHSILWISLLLAAYMGIFGTDISALGNNPIMKVKRPFELSQILYPKSNSQFPFLKFKEEKIGNLKYYSPNSDSITFYQTSDGPLPTANKKMIETFDQHYNHLPQLRTNKIKDGFYSKDRSNQRLLD